MFTVEQRERVRLRLLELAAEDPRVVAAAAVGGSIPGASDRWSDLDLTFGVANDAAVAEVLDDWTRRLTDELDAVRLFDLPHRSSIYRVFLLPGALQLDVSFTPEADFGATGPRFELLFGRAVEKEPPPSPNAEEVFGLAVHHAVRARYSVERGRSWQAELWLSATRDLALELACLSRGLDASYGRELDRLPNDLLEAFERALVRSLEREELLRALSSAIDLLLQESAGADELAARVEPELRRLQARDSALETRRPRT